MCLSVETCLRQIARHDGGRNVSKFFIKYTKGVKSQNIGPFYRLMSESVTKGQTMVFIGTNYFIYYETVCVRACVAVCLLTAYRRPRAHTFHVVAFDIKPVEEETALRFNTLSVWSPSCWSCDVSIKMNIIYKRIWNPNISVCVKVTRYLRTINDVSFE